VSRWTRIRAALTPEEWRRAGLLAAVIVGLHVAGFFILLALVVPHDYSLAGGGVFGLGVGVTAYTLGLRHAFDADHITAIDNTTRKLMAEGQRPLSVGFFFSLGHSTIVFALGALVVAGVRGLSGGTSPVLQAGAVIGPAVSGTFLLLIGLVNLAILRNLLRMFRTDGAEQPPGLAGPMSRVFGRATRAVRKPWHMYPLGCLFGLGFDTATEVGLLVLAGGAAASGLPFYAILCLPILFAAGMSLFDTIDGAFMNFAYGWAFSRPVRKLFYNVAVTGLSVAVALVIGSIELLGVLDVIGDIDLDLVGYLVVGLFVLTWALALAIWRFGRIEERWSAGARRP
jgi:nickel/cobalt transporter (NiCoT) family protein